MLGVFSSYWVRFLMALAQWCCVLLLLLGVVQSAPVITRYLVWVNEVAIPISLVYR